MRESAPRIPQVGVIIGWCGVCFYSSVHVQRTEWANTQMSAVLKCFWKLFQPARWTKQSAGQIIAHKWWPSYRRARLWNTRCWPLKSAIGHITIMRIVAYGMHFGPKITKALALRRMSNCDWHIVITGTARLSWGRHSIRCPIKTPRRTNTIHHYANRRVHSERILRITTTETDQYSLQARRFECYDLLH